MQEQFSLCLCFITLSHAFSPQLKLLQNSLIHQDSPFIYEFDEQYCNLIVDRSVNVIVHLLNLMYG